MRLREEADSTDSFLELLSEGKGMAESKWSKWQKNPAWKELAKKGNYQGGALAGF